MAACQNHEAEYALLRRRTRNKVQSPPAVVRRRMPEVCESATASSTAGVRCCVSAQVCEREGIPVTLAAPDLSDIDGVALTLCTARPAVGGVLDGSRVSAWLPYRSQCN